MSSKNLIHFKFVAMSASLFSSCALMAAEPATLDIGIFKVAPIFTLDQKYDDNIFSQDNNENDSWVSIASPSIQAKATDGTSTYSFGYQLISGFYSNSSDDNYIDNRLSAEGEWELNHRHVITLDAELFDTHEDRGTGFSQGDAALLLSSPDEYRESTLGAGYTFGGIRSKGRLVSHLEYYDKRYTNHRSLTQGRDREEIQIGEAFFWNVGGKTDALFEIEYTDIDYVNDPESIVGTVDSLDSDLIKVFAGATWETTGKTEGAIKLGYAKKSFSDGDRDDYSGFSWDINVKWAPKEYSVITVMTGRRQDESNGSGDFIDGQDFGINWAHEWNDRFDTLLSTNFSNEDYKGDPNEQEDDLFDYSLRVNYEMRRWLTFGTSFKYEERSSNQENQDYKRNIIALHLEASL